MKLTQLEATEATRKGWTSDDIILETDPWRFELGVRHLIGRTLLSCNPVGKLYYK